MCSQLEHHEVVVTGLGRRGRRQAGEEAVAAPLRKGMALRVEVFQGRSFLG